VSLQSSEPEPTGDCYEAAGRYVQDATLTGDAGNLTLVHGVVSGQGPLEGRRIGHAWVEVSTSHEEISLVVDRSQGQNLVLMRGDYYRLGQIDPNECKRYTPEEAIIEMVRSEHWGPWEGVSSDD